MIKKFDIFTVESVGSDRIQVKNDQFDRLMNRFGSNMQPIMNFTFSVEGRKRDLIAEMGDYFIGKVEESGKTVRSSKNSSTYIDQAKSMGERAGSFIFIGWMTSDMDEEVLNKMFGFPIEHSQFGEGFDDMIECDDCVGDGKIGGRYCKVCDGEGEVTENRDYEYASYIIEIDGKMFHIGYDHRGTRIELENMSIDELIERLKVLIDKYIEVL